MARVIPHHGGDAVARTQTKFGERASEPPSAAVKITIRSANDRPVRPARDDFHAAKKLAGALQNRRERQRKIHHRTAHSVVLTGIGTRGILSPFRRHKGTQPRARSRGKDQRKRSPLHGTCRVRGLDSFPLQKRLIFERMPLTAEVPVSLPAVARLPRLPVT